MSAYQSHIEELRKVIGHDECVVVIRLTSNGEPSSCYYDQISLSTMGLSQRCRRFSIEHIHPSRENGEEKRTCNGKKNEPSADNSIHVLQSGLKIPDNATIHDLNVTHTFDSSETNNEKVEHRPTISLTAETPKLNNLFQSKEENVTRSNHSSRVDNTSVPVCATTRNRLREASEELHSTAVTDTQSMNNVTSGKSQTVTESGSNNNIYEGHVNNSSVSKRSRIRHYNENRQSPYAIARGSVSKLNLSKVSIGDDLESVCNDQPAVSVTNGHIPPAKIKASYEVKDSCEGTLPRMDKSFQPVTGTSEGAHIPSNINLETSRKADDFVSVSHTVSHNVVEESQIMEGSAIQKDVKMSLNNNEDSSVANDLFKLPQVSIGDDLESVYNDQSAVSVTNGHIPLAKIKASYEVKDSCEGTLPRMDKSFQPVAGTSEGAHIPRNINLKTSRKANDFVSVSHTVSHNIVDTSYRSLRNENRNNSTLNMTLVDEESQIMESSPSHIDVETILNSNEDSSVANDLSKLPQNIGRVTARTSAIPNTSILKESVLSPIKECGSVGRIKIFTLNQEDTSVSSRKRPMFAFPYSPRRKIPKKQSKSKNYNMPCFTDVDNTTFTSSKKDPVENNHSYIKNVNKSTKNLESIISKEKGETSFPNCQTNQTEYGKKSDKDPKAQSDASLRHSSKTNYSNNDADNNNNRNASSPILDARKKSDSGFSSLRFIKKCSKKPQKDKDSFEPKSHEYKKRGNSLNVGNGHSSSISTVDSSDDMPFINIRSKICKSFGDFCQTGKKLLSKKKTPTPALDRSEVNEDRYNFREREKKSYKEVEEEEFA